MTDALSRIPEPPPRPAEESLQAIGHRLFPEAVAPPVAGGEAPIEPFPQPRQRRGQAPCGECHLRAGETCDVCGASEPASDGFADIVVEGSALIRACAKGYGEPVPWMSAHDACKRFWRMGWRKVAPPALSTCRRCGAENVVTAQSVCIDCVGQPSRVASRVPAAIGTPDIPTLISHEIGKTEWAARFRGIGSPEHVRARAELDAAIAALAQQGEELRKAAARVMVRVEKGEINIPTLIGHEKMLATTDDLRALRAALASHTPEATNG